MATRLELYNGALLLCGERFLASLTEEREPRRLLDFVYNSGGIKYCLERAQWWFATRAVQIDYDPSLQPAFGYNYAFNVPTDWVSTSAVCSDEYYRMPLICHAAEPDYWYAAITPIYVKYTSNDSSYGGDLSRWPQTFFDYAQAYFASRIIDKLGGDKSTQIADLMGKGGTLERTLFTAKNAAAKTQPSQMLAQGRWTRSRLGGRYGGPFGDGGTTGSLIG